jgi:hypothetical protein
MKTYAKDLTVGQRFITDSGIWDTVAEKAASGNGIWIYGESGEAYFYIAYHLVKIG